MNIQKMSLNQIKEIGLKTLSETLGPVGMVRFLQQFENSAGDYTKDRNKWLDETGVSEITKKIKNKR